MHPGLARDQRYRDRMEDRAVTGVLAGALVVGVFDGHGGAAVADHAARHALGAVDEAMGRRLAGKALWRAVFARLDLPLSDCGSTATVLLVHGHTLSVAWVGDSRALLVTGGGWRVLTPDHRITRADERRRVVAAGAALDPPYAVDPVTGQGLMVTRALGDQALRRIGIVAEPEVASVRFKSDDVGFVVATDGLWDVIDEAAVAEVCRTGNPQEAADGLVDLVGAADGTDNVTVVVGHLAEGPARPGR
jgi:protein phosphatase 1L